MSEKIEFKITIPVDNEGYILLQCQNCGNYFKVKSSDLQDEGYLNLYCPCCGLVSKNYLTDDVIELVQAMIENNVMDIMHDETKKMVRNTRHNNLVIKSDSKPKHNSENPIHSTIEEMEIVNFPCCKKTAKIKPLLKMTGCYCVFCGVKDFGIE